MDRRKFIGSIGLILAGTMGPNIYVPKLNPIVWKKPKRYNKLKFDWRVELLQDLQAYHAINAEAELTALIKEAVKPGSIKSIDLKSKLIPDCWCPKYTATIELEESVVHAPYGFYI